MVRLNARAFNIFISWWNLPVARPEGFLVFPSESEGRNRTVAFRQLRLRKACRNRAGCNVAGSPVSANVRQEAKRSTIQLGCRLTGRIGLAAAHCLAGQSTDRSIWWRERRGLIRYRPTDRSTRVQQRRGRAGGLLADRDGWTAAHCLAGQPTDRSIWWRERRGLTRYRPTDRSTRVQQRRGRAGG